MTTTRKEYFSYYSFIIIGYLFLAFFLFFGIYKQNGILFSRSGSILVIFSAIVEYRIVMNQIMKQQFTNGMTTSLRTIASAPNLTRGEKIIRLIAHMSVLLGTLVWGYGDLLI